MHGNVGEWVTNSYAPDALAHYAIGEFDYPAASQNNVTRGGSWMRSLRMCALRIAAANLQ